MLPYKNQLWKAGIANEKSFEYRANYIDLRSRYHKLFLLFKTSYYSLQVSGHDIDILFCRLSQKVTEICFGIVHYIIYTVLQMFVEG